MSQDGVKIYGDLIELDKAKPTILLFHQGRSNARGEYASIIPTLTEQGFNTLAVDQRRGGDLFEGKNRTLENIDQEYTYCETYQDIKAALDYIKSENFSGPIIAWGSSYSAALVVKLAHENPDDIAAVLAFSPASGGPMADCKPDIYFEDLETPLLVLRPSNELEIESVKAQFDLAEKHGHQVFEANPGTHGSSMMVKERVKGSVEVSWNVVSDFLERWSR